MSLILLSLPLYNAAGVLSYVLQGLSLKLEQGQILGLLGRNGVGKTTLVNSIVGFTPPRRGSAPSPALPRR